MSSRTFVLLLAAVWAIGTLVRLGWLFRAGWSQPALQWQGVPLLGTEDGYFFASGVDIALHGNLHELVRFAPAEQHAIGALAWLAAKLLPFSLDEILCYLPALVAPLVAVPTALLGRDLAGPRAGILAGAIVVVAPTFVGRSAAGFFDTDLFSVAVPLFAVWLIVRLLRQGAARDGLFAALVLSVTPFFYNAGGPVSAAVALVAALLLVAFHRSDAFFAPALAAIGLSQLPLPWPLRTALLVPLWFAFRRLPVSAVALRWAAVVAALVGFALSPEWSAALGRLTSFLGGSGAAQPPTEAEVVVGDTTRFVGEAQRLALGNLGRDMVGSTAALVAAFLGMFALLLRHRAVLVAAPLVGLGLFALFGGGRFIIYASGPAAIGIAVCATILSAGVPSARWRTVAFVALGALAVIPTGFFASGTIVRSIVISDEVQAFDAIGKRALPGATTIAWWDWGYPIAYFAHTRTLVDGGERGDDAALAAEILLSPSQHASAMLARLSIEVANRLEDPSGKVAAGLFTAVREQLHAPQMEYLRGLASPSVQPPPPTSEIYLYLPLRMAAILPAVALTRPHEPGNASPRPNVPISFSARTVSASPFRIEMDNGYVVNVDDAVVRGKNGVRPLKAVYVVRGYGETQQVTVSRNPAPPADARSGIYLDFPPPDAGVYLEVDDEMLASVYIQLFMFQNADPALFELVFANRVARVYRLKI